MGRKQRIIAIGLITTSILFAACGMTQRVDPGTMDSALAVQELGFWRGSFQDGEGFVFDGFPLTTEYETFKQRMELTETQVEPSIVTRENPNTGKTETSVSFTLLSEEQKENLNGTVAYHFYDEQFLGGDLKVEGFSDYESAKQFLRKIAVELKSYNIGTQSEEDPNYWGEVETEGIYGQYQCQYLDKRNVKVEMRTQAESGQWWVYLRFAENVSDYGMKNNDSWYFDFSE